MSRWMPGVSRGEGGDHVQHLLSDYIDGCLSSRVVRGVEAHLAVCPACARELEEWRSLLQLVSRHASVRCPIDCADVVLQRLNQSGRTESGGQRAGSSGFAALRALLPPPALWAAVAVLLVALLGGWTWVQGYQSARIATVTAPGSGLAPHAPPAPAMNGEAPERLDSAFGRSDSLILASDFAAEE